MLRTPSCLLADFQPRDYFSGVARPPLPAVSDAITSTITSPSDPTTTTTEMSDTETDTEILADLNSLFHSAAAPTPAPRRAEPQAGPFQFLSVINNGNHTIHPRPALVPPRPLSRWETGQDETVEEGIVSQLIGEAKGMGPFSLVVRLGEAEFRGTLAVWERKLFRYKLKGRRYKEAAIRPNTFQSTSKRPYISRSELQFYIVESEIKPVSPADKDELMLIFDQLFDRYIRCVFKSGIDKDIVRAQVAEIASKIDLTKPFTFAGMLMEIPHEWAADMLKHPSNADFFILEQHPMLLDLFPLSEIDRFGHAERSELLEEIRARPHMFFFLCTDLPMSEEEKARLPPRPAPPPSSTGPTLDVNVEPTPPRSNELVAVKWPQITLKTLMSIHHVNLNEKHNDVVIIRRDQLTSVCRLLHDKLSWNDIKWIRLAWLYESMQATMNANGDTCLKAAMAGSSKVCTVEWENDYRPQTARQFVWDMYNTVLSILHPTEPRPNRLVIPFEIESLQSLQSLNLVFIHQATVFLTPYWRNATSIRQCLTDFTAKRRQLTDAEQKDLVAILPDLDARRTGAPPIPTGSKYDAISAEAVATFVPEQFRVHEILQTHPIVLLSGAPGTGKTTTIRAIRGRDDTTRRPDDAPSAGPPASRLGGPAPPKDPDKLKANVQLTVPTNQLRASHTKKLRPALTVDYLVTSCRYSGAEKWSKVRFLIVDEATMCNEFLFGDLLRFSTVLFTEMLRIVLMGDIDQLASVSPGAVFRDLINYSARNNSSGLAFCTLTINHRTDPNSMAIARNVAAVRTCSTHAIVDDRNFSFVSYNPKAFNSSMYTEYLASQQLLLETQIICYKNQTKLDINLCMMKMAGFLDPRADRIPCHVWEGEKIIFKNDFSRHGIQVSRNQVAIVVSLFESQQGSNPRSRNRVRSKQPSAFNNSRPKTTVDIPAKQHWCMELISVDCPEDIFCIPITPSVLASIEPAYCITTHSLQGGERPFIHLILENAADRSVLYTAVSRGKKRVVVHDATTFRNSGYDDFEEPMMMDEASRCLASFCKIVRRPLHYRVTTLAFVLSRVVK